MQVEITYPFPNSNNATIENDTSIDVSILDTSIDFSIYQLCLLYKQKYEKWGDKSYMKSIHHMCISIKTAQWTSYWLIYVCIFFS